MGGHLKTQAYPWRHSNSLKGELGELEFHFRKIPLHQQKFLVVPILSNSLGCREI